MGWHFMFSAIGNAPKRVFQTNEDTFSHNYPVTKFVF